MSLNVKRIFYRKKKHFKMLILIFLMQFLRNIEECVFQMKTKLMKKKNCNHSQDNSKNMKKSIALIANNY